MLVRILCFLASLLLAGASLAQGTPVEKQLFSSKLTIYLAKGAPDSCGQGCDRWIAIEGEVDRDAASRIRRFLAGVKDMQRPIYLHSPGGNVEQSYLIARLLRGRKAIARIGRTSVAGCASDIQADAACLKIKNAGGEIEAELSTRGAICNSACGYLFLGATSREVAPDAVIAVHSSKLVFFVRGNPPPGAVADYRRREMASADRARVAFITSMGVSRELDSLISTVKFESRHVLTRQELFRFGIDTRPIAESTWTLTKDGRPSIRKLVTVKKDDGTFQMMEWRLSCENNNRVPLVFVSEIDEAATGKSTILMAGNADTGKEAGGLAVRTGKYEVWSGAVQSDMVKTVLASRSLQVRKTTPMPDGKTDTMRFDLDATGLVAMWPQLVASCQATPARAVSSSPAVPWPNVTTAPSALPTH